ILLYRFLKFSGKKYPAIALVNVEIAGLQAFPLIRRAAGAVLVPSILSNLLSYEASL
ncbi:MAG: hypothetical protein QG635_1270, partial [Bacteroidota bacterium]|nr:hypothetical protein [Bacteroidota bacterium]